MSTADPNSTAVALRIEPPLAWITLQRPEKLNALNAATLDQFEAALDEVERRAPLQASETPVRVLIITGAGEKAFVAGADIGELAGLTPPEGYVFSRRGQRLFERLARLPIPAIAAINGYALGGGLELALACTLRIAAEGARLGLPEVKLGILPGYGGTQRLPRLIGAARALELILTAAPVTAAEAHRLGLVNRVVPAAELLAQAEAWALQIAQQAPVAVRCCLEAVRNGMAATLEAGLELEAGLFGVACASQDKTEGTQAFLEKRPAKFQGH